MSRRRVEPNDTCIFCGCFEAQACPEGCAWSDLSLPGAPICTSCETMAGELGRVALELGAAVPAPAPGGRLLDNPGRAERIGRALLVWLCVQKEGPGVTVDRWGQAEDDEINDGRKAYRKIQRLSARKLEKARGGSRSDG